MIIMNQVVEVVVPYWVLEVAAVKRAAKIGIYGEEEVQ
jgi:hypothetical protein